MLILKNNACKYGQKITPIDIEQKQLGWHLTVKS